MSFSLIFQFKESQFLLRIVAEYIGDVIFVWSAPQKFKKKSSVNIFVTGDDRKEPLRYKEPLLHTVYDRFTDQPFKWVAQMGKSESGQIVF